MHAILFENSTFGTVFATDRPTDRPTFVLGTDFLREIKQITAEQL